MSIRGQARRQVRVEYEPLYDELDEVLEQAKQTVKTGTRAERQVARAIIRQARGQRPAVNRDYRRVQGAGRRANRLVTRQSGGSNIFMDAIAQEAAGFQRRTAEQRQGELGELRGRQLRARDAQVFNTRALRQDFRGTQAEVAEGRAKLARQESNALSTLIDQLRAEQAEKEQEAAELDLAERRHGLDVQEFNLRAEDVRTDNRRQAREARSKGKSGGLTYAQRRDKQADIAKARTWLLKLRQAGMPLPRARDAIVQGRIPRKEGADITLDIPAQYVDAAVRDLRRGGGGMQGFFNRLGQSLR